MRTDFRELIEHATAELVEVYERVNRALLNRNRDDHGREEWERACAAFHSQVSVIDPYLQRACDAERYADKELIEFVVCFLEADPRFFRSGYLKQILITRLKRSDLGETVKRRLREVLIDAVNRRGGREFRYYCRLAVQVADEGLAAQLKQIVGQDDPARASRAAMMLEHIRQHSHR